MKTRFTTCFPKTGWSTTRLTLQCVLLFVSLNCVVAQTDTQTFVNVRIPGLPGLSSASVSWADYDNDGRLDVLITGVADEFSSISPTAVIPFTKLYRNTGKGFEDMTKSLLPDLDLHPVGKGSVAWADYDGDKQPDFIITGTTGTGSVSKLYRNTGNGFQDVTQSQFAAGSNTNPGKALFDVMDSSVSWGDYDQDGRPDLLLLGANVDFGRVSRLYHNTSKGFIDVTDQMVPGLPALSEGSLAWVDYDLDGWLECLITGGSKTSEYSLIYRNEKTHFRNINAGLPGVYTSSVAWGDYDNDGRPDLLLAGSTGITSNTSRLYHNTANGFEDVTNKVVKGGLPGLYWSALAWGDYDGDNRLDFLITGGPSLNEQLSRLYHNTANGFEDITDQLAQRIPQVTFGSVTWADYDNDKHLDFLITGSYDGRNRISRLYRNVPPGQLSGTFVNVTKKVPVDIQVDYSTAAWADYDGDGLQDFFLLCQKSTFDNKAWLFRNTGKGWEDVTATMIKDLPGGMKYGSVAWGDYDKDGRPDLLITGNYGTGLVQNHFSGLYRNTKDEGFVHMTSQVPNLPQYVHGNVSWADFNQDGWLDFLITGALTYLPAWEVYPCAGTRQSCNPIYYPASWTTGSRLYLNNSGKDFTDVTNSWFRGHAAGIMDLPPFGASVSWGDYNGDGMLDFIIGGHFAETRHLTLFQNIRFKNEFQPANDIPWANVITVYGDALAWADYDNDGKLDLITTGLKADLHKGSKLYHNRGIAFDDMTVLLPDLPQVANSSVAWADYDGDKRLDLFISGESANGAISKLYHNTGPGFEDVTEDMIPDISETAFKSASWADYDKDGRPDLLLTGSGTTRIYHNEVLKVLKQGESEQALQLIAPLYDCQSGAFVFRTTGGDGSPIEYEVEGITGWTTNSNQLVDEELRRVADAQPLTLTARQKGKRVHYVWDIRVACPVDEPGRLRLMAPVYDCASGAFTFQTSGGNSSGAPAAPIEYMAPGITGWTTNPNQLVDATLRQAADAQPLRLQMRQQQDTGGVYVEDFYDWDIRAICPVSTAGARLSAGDTERTPSWQARVWPNPVSNELTVQLEGAQGESVQLVLRNLRGQVLVEQQVLVDQASQTERLPLDGTGTGLYLLRVSTPTRSQTLKVIKVP